ncbi:MAG TPA: hypothetical protein VEK57_14670 [Thermoanaerobaculia bacterium]|nr:hypothetical protein [Thermoanaerobaculia bacterium]
MKTLLAATGRLSVLALVLLYTDAASAVECVNRFVSRTQRPHQVITLLTGKFTFQEAQELAKKMNAGQAPLFEWVNDQGKLIAKQTGELKVVRPMSVGCDGKKSGVMVIASFLSVQSPSKKMFVKLDANTTVEFVQQAD